MAGTYVKWPPQASGGGGTGPATTIAFSIGSMDAQAASVNGASVSSTSIFMQSASSASGGFGVGLVNTVAQSFLGTKTFANAPVFSSLTGNQVVTSGSGSGVQLSTVGYGAANIVNTLVLRDGNGSANATNFVSLTTTTQSSGTSQLLLDASSSHNIKIIGSASFTITLPKATNLYPGQSYEINNNTGSTLPVVDIGSNSVTNILAGAYAFVICVDNTTTNGSWDVAYLAPRTSLWGSSGLGVTGSLSATSLQSVSPLFSNLNGALVQGSVSLTNQVVGNLPLTQVSGVLSQANMSSTSLVLGVNTFGSLSASQVTTSPLSPNAQVMTNGANQLVVGSVNLTTQVTGSVSIANVNATGLSPNAQVSTNGTGQLVVTSVSLVTQVTGILPQANLTLTPTFTQATIGSVTVTSSAGGAAYTLRYPGGQGPNLTFLQNDGSGNLNWGAAPNAVTGSVTQTSSVGGASYTISWPGSQASSSASYLENNGLGGLFWKQPKGPTVQTFSSASGTYTTPTNPSPLYLQIKMVGGGGGASGNGGGSNGGAGGNTSFGSTSFLLCNGGGGGTNGGASGNGGTAVLGSSSSGIASGFAVTGGAGGGGAGVAAESAPGGGSSPFGGAGLGASGGGAATNGGNAAFGSGSGGGGSANTANGCGSAGGAGGYIEAIVVSPAASYGYSIGTGGLGGTGGAAAGGNGGTGTILVYEYYQ